MGIKGIALVLAVILVLAIVPVLSSATFADVDGAAIYKAKCRMCHGDSGKGDTKAGEKMGAPDLTAGVWKHGKSLAEVEKVITDGSGKMPKYASKLSAAEITAVATHLRTLCGVTD